jgi:hypothetical protein
MVQQPRIVFVLDAPADVIYSRKKELTLDEIQRQLEEFDKLSNLGDNFYKINANQTPEKMVLDVNEKTSEIAAQVGRTPQNWNSSVFSMIQNLSESVVVPIAGIIITLVLCYELISMLTERNNLHLSKTKNTPKELMIRTSS